MVFRRRLIMLTALLSAGSVAIAAAEGGKQESVKPKMTRTFQSSDDGAPKASEARTPKRRSKNRLACSVPTGCGDDLCGPCPKN